ncbi:hypothetical protein JOD03_001204 [Chryseomicrobium aureum]|uniref:hypothetical protein n=1 Tax=Chryseomicrobium aureum TaxID=1441723 RepID=UPI00195D430D|nr:hypothetical protein [Chryseomicrobium aureum]MBM7706302.1 hypothetical protein [Chryseomicrobium aureum]
MEKWENELKKISTEQKDIEDVWERINGEMDRDLRKERRRLMMQRSWIGAVATMVLVLGTLIYFSINNQSPEITSEVPSTSDSDSTTTTGDDQLTRGEPGFVEQELTKIDARFPETKEVPLQIEGTEEMIAMSRVVPGNFAYVLYADEELYEISFDSRFDSNTTDESSASIVARNSLGTDYPEVKLQIDTIPGKKPTELASEKAALLEEKYSGATIDSELVTEPVVGYKLHAREGDSPSSEVTTIYVLDQQHDESTIVVTQTVFLEAQEGHGARFFSMLKTLQVLD